MRMAGLGRLWYQRERESFVEKKKSRLLRDSANFMELFCFPPTSMIMSRIKLKQYFVKLLSLSV